MERKLLIFLFLFLIFFPIGRIVYQRWNYYLSSFRPEEVEKAYGISQYVLEKAPSWISDEIHFAYASWRYLKGGSPILINPDYPPLGKYIIAFSIKFWHNEKIPILLFSLTTPFSIYLISQLFIESKTWALVPVILFSWEKLFQEQLIYIPLFELFSLTFLNLSFYFFLKAEVKNSYFWLSSLFLGALWATKPWMLTIPLVISWFIYLIFKRDFRKLLNWLISLLAAFLVVILSYFRLLIEGWNIYKILSAQKWIMWYHRSKLIKPASVWPFIYLRRWYVWWGEKPFLPVEQWNILWPTFTTLALVFSALVFLKTYRRTKKGLRWLKFDKRVIAICLWFFGDLIFLSLGNINVRYLFYLLPFAYILGIYFLFNSFLAK